MQQTIQLVLLLVLPYLFILGCKHNRVLGWLSPVVLCYGLGILVGNINAIPLDTGLSNQITSVSVVLAIPLLLFSTDFGRWLRLAPSTVLSFLLCLIAVSVSAIFSVWFFGNDEVPLWKVAGMMVGMFTGGTPNMTAVGKALEVDSELYILVSASEIVTSGVYFMFLMAFAQRIYLLFLPAFVQTEDENALEEDACLPGLELFDRKEKVIRLLFALLLSIGIAGISSGAVYLVVGALPDAPVLLLITTLGILGSLIKPIRTLPGSYDMGQYLLLVFSLAIGTMADFGSLVEGSSTVFIFCTLMIVMTTVLHLIAVWLFRIDADTVIITATASLFGPAFVGPVAGAMRNREVVVSGLTTGLVGYAVGNYLGLAIAWLLQP